ncbi:MAG: hypothetical protein WBD40_21090 [Tepidisphaeraceae bacterium]
MQVSAEEHNRAAEAKLRRELAKIQAEILEKHSGNEPALLSAMHHGMSLVTDAVQRNELSPPVAEGLKKQIQDWVY